MKCLIVVIAAFAGAPILPAAADPRLAPTVDYIAEVDITNGLDRRFKIPMYQVHFYAGRKFRVDMVSNVFLYDFERQQTTLVMPRIKKYDPPVAFGEQVADARRWIGVEAITAEPLETGTLLGRAVTKYRARGRIFDSSAFEGDVWSTAENIVLRLDGVAQFPQGPSPVTMTTTKLMIGPVEPRLLVVPSDFRRSDE